MKSLSFTLVILAFFFATSAFSQSNSFSLLKNNYEDADDVHVFSLDGFFCKAIFSLTANDPDFRDAVKNINSFELITIPNATFAAGRHTREGFRKLLKKDNFESLATVKEHGDNVEIFVQTNGRQKDRYLMWTEGESEITAIEVEGDIDVNKLIKQSKNLAKASE